MHRLALVLFAALAPLAAPGADLFEAFVSGDAPAEARRAFASGDRRHIVVPVCLPQGGEVMPGWPTSGPTPPEMWAALEKGQRPFQCTDLGEGTRTPRFTRLVKYAEQYNRTLLELGRR